ncbi:hypothetical protein MNEG_0955 [Monoraphidium neglectum]|uniref:Aldehyde dehydrogenase domain-containing protein n=1 Tax=Monoraphidium neglectum TaxID=145388 RepID=A0A0D2N3P9_9CHLO|nr:hypothetical protein MNEG_0955 [Monoraphidium neglectum]KIZ06992.1 hypothetical protein MNEG_0955 [Monoraphidium neglectum]|eukprot:XP_013906011.1 hypothetical protein MNEG_0955 [Monoraphidium neglectum]
MSNDACVNAASASTGLSYTRPRAATASGSSSEASSVKVVHAVLTKVRRLVAEAGGRYPEPFTLELGSKNPLIVEPDSDLDLAFQPPSSQDVIFFHQGQVCCAGSRVFVHEAVYDVFVARSTRAAQDRPVGNPFEAEVLQGPQVDSAEFNKAMRHINLGRTEGARLAAGGRRVRDKGFFVEPTVFTGGRDDMTIARDETFGPVQSIMSYKSLDEVRKLVIKRANATPSGLAAGVFSSNLDTVNTLARALKGGTVAVPIRSYKDSGMGREKGEDALQHYTQVKAVVQQLRGAAGI